jgi:hypothetical protein
VIDSLTFVEVIVVRLFAGFRNFLVDYYLIITVAQS